MSLHVLSLTCLSVPFCGRPERTVIQQLVWPAETAGRLWKLGVLSSNLNIVYVILCFVAKNKVFSFFRTLLLSPSAPSPDRIYSPNYGFSRGDGVALSPPQQGVLLGRQQEELAASHRAYAEVSLQLNQLVERLDQLQASLSVDRASTSAPGPDGAVPRHAEPRLNPPAPYSGEPNSC